MNSNRDINQTAFRKMRDELEERFAPGHFVAFDAGRLVADAESFDQLTEALQAINKDRPNIFVVQIGVEYPNEVFILL